MAVRLGGKELLLRKIPVLLVLTIPLGACFSPSPTDPNFLMGVRGGGRLTFLEGGALSHRSGECAQQECRMTLDAYNFMTLTAIANEHFTFRFWEGSIQERHPCPLLSGYIREDKQIEIQVSEDSACIAVFEAEGPGSGTVPGGDR